MRTRFERAMWMMRRHDPQQREDGFALLKAHAAEHLNELLVEFGRETEHGLRCWLLELIAHARSPKALPLLAEQLYGSDEALRDWAITGLRLLGGHEAGECLYRARVNGWIGT